MRHMPAEWIQRFLRPLAQRSSSGQVSPLPLTGTYPVTDAEGSFACANHTPEARNQQLTASSSGKHDSAPIKLLQGAALEAAPTSSRTPSVIMPTTPGDRTPQSARGAAALMDPRAGSVRFAEVDPSGRPKTAMKASKADPSVRDGTEARPRVRLAAPDNQDAERSGNSVAASVAASEADISGLHGSVSVTSASGKSDESRALTQLASKLIALDVNYRAEFEVIMDTFGASFPNTCLDNFFREHAIVLPGNRNNTILNIYRCQEDPEKIDGIRLLKDIDKAAFKRFVLSGQTKHGETVSGASTTSRRASQVQKSDKSRILNLVTTQLSRDKSFSMAAGGGEIADTDHIEEMLETLDLGDIQIPVGTRARYVPATDDPESFQVPVWSLRAMHRRKAERERFLIGNDPDFKKLGQAGREALRKRLARRSMFQQQEIIANAVVQAARLAVEPSERKAENKINSGGVTISRAASTTGRRPSGVWSMHGGSAYEAGGDHSAGGAPGRDGSRSVRGGRALSAAAARARSSCGAQEPEGAAADGRFPGTGDRSAHGQPAVMHAAKLTRAPPSAPQDPEPAGPGAAGGGAHTATSSDGHRAGAGAAADGEGTPKVDLPGWPKLDDAVAIPAAAAAAAAGVPPRAPAIIKGPSHSVPAVIAPVPHKALLELVTDAPDHAGGDRLASMPSSPPRNGAAAANRRNSGAPDGRDVQHHSVSASSASSAGRRLGSAEGARSGEHPPVMSPSPSPPPSRQAGAEAPLALPGQVSSEVCESRQSSSRGSAVPGGRVQ